MRSHRRFRARRAVLRGQPAQRYLSTRSDAAERTQVGQKQARERQKNPFDKNKTFWWFCPYR